MKNVSREAPLPRAILVTSAIAMTCIAALIWFYILKGGGANRLRAVNTVVALTKGGDPAMGYQTIQSVGCIGCHEIPGVQGSRGKVGPSLKTFKDRAMIAGVMANSADNLIHWIQHPREVDPKTAMPELGLTEKQARDIAAYLYAPR